MKAPVTRILLPVTTDRSFSNASLVSLAFAERKQAEITLAVIDDDSQPYETVPLPFHEKNRVHTEDPDGEIFNGHLVDRASRFLLAASEREIDIREVLVRGHAATQILLLSRFYDLIILSESPHFPGSRGERMRRINPIFEVLDQTVVPVLVVARDSSPKIASAALFFDGGPHATSALQNIAGLFYDQLDIPIFIRVCLDDLDTAQRLGDECEGYMRSKGFWDVRVEVSGSDPIEALQTEVFTPVDFVALGIRSRHSYHDLHVGLLAKHFLEHPGDQLTLFC